MSNSGYALAADVMVVVHLGFMLYVILGEGLIVAGLLAGWEWVRRPWFRWTHLAAILIVVAETFVGMECPLTRWERELRTQAGQVYQDRDASFTGRLVRQVLFPDGLQEDHWAFTASYIGFGALVLATFLLAPPRRRPARAAAQPAEAVGPTTPQGASRDRRTPAMSGR